MTPGSFENFIYKMCLEIIYSMYMYKKDLVLNNLQWLICHKTKPNRVPVKYGITYIWFDIFVEHWNMYLFMFEYRFFFF